LVIVTGLSGAGKSQALAAFEDLGFYCLDNLPPTLLPQIVTLAAASGYDRLAIAPDVRTSGPFGDLSTSIASASMNGTSPEILFLDATEEALVRRFSETRRKHPIARERLTEAIASERSELAPLRDRAERIWDTSALSALQLRRRIAETYAQQTPLLHVTVVSFGYKYGLPLDADMVFDVRFLPNPYYVDELRELTGLDKPVGDYLERLPETRTFLQHAETMLDFLIPRFIDEGKAQLTIAIGCTGGRHRSVYLAERLQQFLRKNPQLTVEVVARDIRR
jgi:UPF0042 nucleotide-binding protein